MIRRLLAAAALGALLGCSSAEPPVTIEGAPGEAPADPSFEPADGVVTTTARSEYPSPPYGTEIGAVIENFRFLGWSDPGTAGYDAERLEAVELSRFYDPRGEGSVRYVVITATAVWCSVCRAEYEDFRSGRFDQFSARGVAFVGVLFEDNDSNPARPSDLALWAENFDVAFPFVLDPAFKLGRFFNREATPMTMVVDTQTMRITWLEVGWAVDGPSSLWAYLDSVL